MNCIVDYSLIASVNDCFLKHEVMIHKTGFDKLKMVVFPFERVHV